MRIAEKSRVLSLIAFVVVVGCAPAERPPAPEPTAASAFAVAPDHYTLAAETAGARLVTARWAPGDTDTLHSHPDLIWYALTDVRLLLDVPGDERELVAAAGECGTVPAVAGHTATNLAETEARMLLFELPGGAVVVPGGVPDAVTAAPAHYRVFGESDRGRLLLAHWRPGERDALHAHPDMIVFALTDARIRLTTRDGTVSEVVFAAGESRAVAGDGGHVAENVGTAEARLLLLEPK